MSEWIRTKRRKCLPIVLPLGRFAAKAARRERAANFAYLAPSGRTSNLTSSSSLERPPDVDVAGRYRSLAPRIRPAGACSDWPHDQQMRRLYARRGTPRCCERLSQRLSSIWRSPAAAPDRGPGHKNRASRRPEGLAPGSICSKEVSAAVRIRALAPGNERSRPGLWIQSRSTSRRHSARKTTRPIRFSINYSRFHSSCIRTIRRKPST